MFDINRTLRTNDWWSPKLSPLLAVAYATILICNKSIIELVPALFFLLASLLVGAVYVSTINDITDIKEDIAVGKTNRMVKIPANLRWLIPGSCIALGIVFTVMLYPDYWSMFFYLMPWIVFSMYSMAPIRLKKRGVWGVLADASGAHLFTSCFIVSSVSFYCHQPINWIWFSAVAIWAFAWGLRGILWHQFHDRDADISIGIKTYASKVNPLEFKPKSVFLIFVELTSFFVMLIIIDSVIAGVFLLFYLVYLFVRYKLFYARLTIVIPRDYGNYQILMHEYYQIFLPVSLLLIAALHQHLVWIVLIVHLTLFSKNFYLHLKEIFSINVLQRIYKSAKAKLSTIKSNAK